MASAKELKKRIGTVKNTQQITRAMKMVSAAKLRRAQEAISANRPYAKGIDRMIRRLARETDLPIETPLIRRDVTDSEKKPVLAFVIVTADRGLCGAFNASIIRAAEKWLRENSDSYSRILLGFIGKKGHEYFRRKKDISTIDYIEVGARPRFEDAKKFTDGLIDQFITGEVDEIKFIYNEFKSAIQQIVTVEDFLPLMGSDELLEEESKGVPESREGETGIYMAKPSAKVLMEALLAKHFAVQNFRIMLESSASEHGARMSAMENATTNAGEVIRKLTLQYNKERQTGITTEMLEIVAGSESQKEM